jgi:hypothetical protein
MRRSLFGGLIFLVAALVTPITARAAGPTMIPSAPRAAGESFAADGLNVPWVGGGMRIERDGSLRDFAGDWPTVPFGSLRLWDARTAWLDLEPANDQWSFGHLDAILSKADERGVGDVLLVLGGTPRWAAGRVLDTDAAWMGPGSAAMPADLDDWRDYVATVARRYAGRIDSYEIGNEPNLLTYWSGTPTDWARLVSAAAEEIRRADASARILISGGMVQDAQDVEELGTWLRPVAGLAKAGRVDGLALHYYPTAYGTVRDVAGTASLLGSALRAISAAGWASVPRWITEMNVRHGSDLAAAVQVQAISSLVRQARSSGFERVYWYAWTDLGPEDLIQFYPGQAGEEAMRLIASLPANGLD